MAQEVEDAHERIALRDVGQVLEVQAEH